MKFVNGRISAANLTKRVGAQRVLGDYAMKRLRARRVLGDYKANAYIELPYWCARVTSLVMIVELYDINHNMIQ